MAGNKITMSNGVLRVPDDPIIPFIEGDGTGADIWAASVRVLDASVQKAFNGKKKIGAAINIRPRFAATSAHTGHHRRAGE